jgi:hypothetical protein
MPFSTPLAVGPAGSRSQSPHEEGRETARSRVDVQMSVDIAISDLISQTSRPL